jgi:hypothetical protein
MDNNVPLNFTIQYDHEVEPEKEVIEEITLEEWFRSSQDNEIWTKR